MKITNYKKQELMYEKLGIFLAISAIVVNALRYQAKLKQIK